VTGLVYDEGSRGTAWWSFFLGNDDGVSCSARLWRRSELITDVQFAEMRYAGKPAAFLRGFALCIWAADELFDPWMGNQGHGEHISTSLA